MEGSMRWTERVLWGRNGHRYFPFEKDYLEKTITGSGPRDCPVAGSRLFGMVQPAYFIDIGIPADYARVQDRIQGTIMIYRSKAPFRIGLAGGGTDVSPYSDLYGGAILNATLSLYAHASIEPLDDYSIILQGLDRREEVRFDEGARMASLPIDGRLDLLKGVYNRIRNQYGWAGKGFRLSTFVDVPAGSGLGTSSTLVVAIIGAFMEMLRLPLGEYDMSHLAYDIEGRTCGWPGKAGPVCRYFGGVNYMEFYKDDKVIVNPLRVKQQYLFELENNFCYIIRPPAGSLQDHRSTEPQRCR